MRPAATATNRAGTAPKGPHLKIPLPAAGKQQFAVVRIRVQRIKGSRPAPRKLLRITAANLAALPESVRAAAGYTRSRVKRSVATVTVVVAINDLSFAAAAEWSAYKVSYFELFACGSEVEDAIDQIETLARLGPWPSPPSAIFANTEIGRASCRERV